MKGLNCSILESKTFGNCSNGGVSSRCKEVTLCPDPDAAKFQDWGIPALFESCLDAPAVVLRTIKVSGREHVYAVPYELSDGGSMFGGSFIYCSDSRFPMEYPIPLHDRVEYGVGYAD